MKKNISQLVKYNMCAGCGLCESHFGEKKVKVKTNDCGSFQPYFTDKFQHDDEAFFCRICPVLQGYKIEHDNKSFNKVLGNVLTLSYGHSSQLEIRKKCSSGGGITALLIFMLENNYVDAVIQIGKNSNNIFETEVKISKTKDEILDCTGSKYMPAASLKNINNMLVNNYKYAFVGRPCEVQALRNYAGINKSIDEKIKYYISFLCGGIPSINATYHMIDNLKTNINNINEIQYRGDGWPGYTTIKRKDGLIDKIPYSISWGKYLAPYVPLICKMCFDGIGNSADIVFGDAWYLDDCGAPDFSEHEGRNIIITRTETGKDILVKAVEKKNITLSNTEVPYSEFEKVQPSQTGRRNRAYEKILGLKLLGIVVPNVSLKELKRIKLPRIRLISVLGSIKRVFNQKK